MVCKASSSFKSEMPVSLRHLIVFIKPELCESKRLRQDWEKSITNWGWAVTR